MSHPAVERATERSIEAIIDSVAADSIAEALDGGTVLPEHLAYDEVALAVAAYRSLAEIDLELREEAITDLAVTAPEILRISQPGDMTSVPLARVEELAGRRDLSGLARLSPDSGPMRGTAHRHGLMRVGLDAAGVARLASGIEISSAISGGIRTAMEGELSERTRGLLEAIRGYLESFGLRRTARYVRDLICDLAGHGSAALEERGFPPWQAYVMTGRTVAIVCASVYLAATRSDSPREEG